MRGLSNPAASILQARVQTRVARTVRAVPAEGTRAPHDSLERWFEEPLALSMMLCRMAEYLCAMVGFSQICNDAIMQSCNDADDANDAMMQ